MRAGGIVLVLLAACRLNFDNVASSRPPADAAVDAGDTSDAAADAACNPRVIDEPGEDLCTAGYPKNFIPFAHALSGTSTGCGGSGATVAIGYTSQPQVTFAVGPPLAVPAGTTIEIRATTWASGSTMTAVSVGTSVDGSFFSACGTISGIEHLGNQTAYLVTCTAPVAGNMLHVQLMATGSVALIYLRALQVDLPDTCP